MPPVNYNVTIELDADEDAPLEMDMFPEMSFDEDDDVVIDNPISITDVVCKISPEISVLFLSQEVRDLISINLNIPTGVSIASWAQVADYLNSNNYIQLENDENYGEEMLEQFNDLPVQLFMNALEKAQRVDILVKLKMIIETGNYLRAVKDLTGISGATTASARSLNFRNPPQELKYSGNNIVLIMHYEKTATEKENFKWFMKNIRRNMRADSSASLVPLDVVKLEKDDGGNILKKLDDMFPEFPHIVVCFNKSYLTALYSTENDTNFTFRKLIHERMVIEFMNNQMRNKRFRCVVMPDSAMAGLTDWSAVTYHYNFPDDFGDLLKRLLDKQQIKLKTDTSTC